MAMVKKQQMACLSLFVMVILQMESLMFFADGSARFNKLVSGSSPNNNNNNYPDDPIKIKSDRLRRDDFVVSRHGFEENVGETGDHGDDEGDGDDIWVDEKRRIHTGPNPLHNR